ncbi:MAG TPA: TlpA disulfide reductase family protein [Flavobacteriaceae bacterium]
MKHKLKRISIIQLLMYLCLTINGWSQEKTDIILQANVDWEELDSIKDYFGTPKEGMSFLERRQYDDYIATKKSKLAADFLRNYPDNPHYDEVLNMYFHSTFAPYFIKEKISDSLVHILNQLSIQLKEAKSNDLKVKLICKLNRTLPINNHALEQWLQNGSALVTKILESNASLDYKMNLEQRLFNRDIDLALKRYQALYKDPNEIYYWKQFDAQYWEPYRLRMIGLLNKYSNIESMATYVQSFIGYVSSYSPSLKETYWKDFLNKTNNTVPLADQPAFKVLHKIATENLEAIEFLKVASPNKPLEMRFADMDGNTIDLDNMRGKVVLIDFWSIRCVPCIKEMPHLVDMYKKYRDQGFEVIGIVAEGDDAKEAVLKITQKANATWPQSLDKGKTTTVSYLSLFNISSFPTVWLLNKEGKLVDKQARGNRLEPLIRKHLGLEQLKFDYRNPSFKLNPNNERK